MAEITAGEAVVRVLERSGVEAVFGVLSVHNLPLYAAIARRASMRAVAARSETGAVGMADGYARATGRLGVVITSTGVGAANGAGALLEAYTASSPLLHLTGQVDSSVVAEERGALHGAKDQLSMLRSVGKDARRLTRAEDAPHVTCEAIRLARSGRPGPVSVEIPIDLQYATLAEIEVQLDEPERCAPGPDAIASAAERLASARRPLIWAGGGVRLADASGALRALAEWLGAGVITTQAGRGAIPEDHPLCIGYFGMDPAVEPLLAEADALLAVGTRFRSNETRNWQLPLPRPLLRIDIDPQEVTRNYQPDLALVGDARLTLEALLRALGETAPDARVSGDAPNAPTAPQPVHGAAPDPDRRARAPGPGWRSSPADPDWRARVADARRAARARWRAMLGPHERLLDDLRTTLPRTAIVVRDVTVPATVWGSRLLDVREPRAALHSASMAIGQGLPMAIGAAVGRPDRVIVLLAGDGGFATSLGELTTAVQERLRLVIILFNDAGYGILRNLQDAHFGGQRFGVDLHAPDFARTAEATGAMGCHVASLLEFSPALSEALASTGPVLVEVDLQAIGPMATPFTGAARLVP